MRNDFETGFLNVEEDARTKRLIVSLLKQLSNGSCDEPFKEKNFFQSKEADVAEMELLTEI